MAEQPLEDEVGLLQENHRLINFPNPFARYTTVEAYVAEGSENSELILYNLLGMETKRYGLREGYNTVTVLAEDLPKSGIYFYTLEIDSDIAGVGKMILLK